MAGIEIRLTVQNAKLVIAREFEAGSCIERGALAAAEHLYAGALASMRRFWERARPGIAGYAAAAGWMDADDAVAAESAFAAWLKARLSELLAAAETAAGGSLQMPPSAATDEAARRACPAYDEERRRFAEREVRRRGLDGTNSAAPLAAPGSPEGH